MSSHRKLSAVAALTTALVLATALPASASGYKSGSKSCGSGATVATYGEASGTQSHYINSLSKTFPDSGWTVVARRFGSPYTTANWTVGTTGAINASSTYAYCAG